MKPISVWLLPGQTSAVENGFNFIIIAGWTWLVKRHNMRVEGEGGREGEGWWRQRGGGWLGETPPRMDSRRLLHEFCFCEKKMWKFLLRLLHIFTIWSHKWQIQLLYLYLHQSSLRLKLMMIINSICECCIFITESTVNFLLLLLLKKIFLVK